MAAFHANRKLVIRRSVMARLRYLRDVMMLFVLPGVSLTLPWRVVFLLYKWLAHCNWLYRQETAASLTMAKHAGLVSDDVDWAYSYRLMRLVDHADLYLTLTRRDSWMHRYLKIEGSGWPALDRPFLAITFHWGAGLWGLRNLRAQGRDVAVLVRDLVQEPFRGQPIIKAYVRLRSWQTHHSGGADTILSNANSLREIKKRIVLGQNVVALFDVPAEGKNNVCYGNFLGRRGVFPRGLLFAAVRYGIPIVVYTTRVDINTGERVLWVSEPVTSDDEDRLRGMLIYYLERAVVSFPSHWHQWAGAEAFFSGSHGIA